jgi:hypothetical protein
MNRDTVHGFSLVGIYVALFIFLIGLGFAIGGWYNYENPPKYLVAEERRKVLQAQDKKEAKELAMNGVWTALAGAILGILSVIVNKLSN